MCYGLFIEAMPRSLSVSYVSININQILPRDQDCIMASFILNTSPLPTEISYEPKSCSSRMSFLVPTIHLPSLRTIMATEDPKKGHKFFYTLTDLLRSMIGNRRAEMEEDHQSEDLASRQVVRTVHANL